MTEIATAHGFVLRTRGACNGDTWMKENVKLILIGCKHSFRLFINGNEIRGREENLEKTLQNHSL